VQNIRAFRSVSTKIYCLLITLRGLVAPATIVPADALRAAPRFIAMNRRKISVEAIIGACRRVSPAGDRDRSRYHVARTGSSRRHGKQHVPSARAYAPITDETSRNGHEEASGIRLTFWRSPSLAHARVNLPSIIHARAMRRVLEDNDFHGHSLGDTSRGWK